MAGNFEDLKIYRDATSLFGRIHGLSHSLPPSEKYELATQIRRAADSISSNIVEGYGRRRHKTEFLRFITIAHASGLEVMAHLDKIALVYPEQKDECTERRSATDLLCRRIFTFKRYVEQHWNKNS